MGSHDALNAISWVLARPRSAFKRGADKTDTESGDRFNPPPDQPCPVSTTPRMVEYRRGPIALFGPRVRDRIRVTGARVTLDERVDCVRRPSKLVMSLLMPLVPMAGGCFTAAPPPDYPGSPDADSTSGKCFTHQDAERMSDQVLQLVNLERGEADLPPVNPDPTLARIADEYACKMIEEEFFGHRDPANDHGPGERAVAARYAFFAVGENLAAGQESPAEVMKVWMESPSHRAIILDGRWTEVGIAVRVGGKHGIYWVQEFGDPAGY